MKFRDTSIHRLKVKKKWCGHTDKPKAICPTNFFKVGGIKKNKITPDAPKNESVLSQLIMMGKSICHLWVKLLTINDFL